MTKHQDVLVIATIIQRLLQNILFFFLLCSGEEATKVGVRRLLLGKDLTMLRVELAHKNL